MQLMFSCYSNKDNRDWEEIFTIEWNSNPMPRKGDKICFDHIVEEWPDGDKKEFFYDRWWTIENADWAFNDTQGMYSPTFWLKISEQ